MSTTDKDYDPIKNPRPEDLHAHGIVSALAWFAVLFAIVVALYYGFVWLAG